MLERIHTKIRLNLGKFVNILVVFLIVLLGISLFRNISRIEKAKEKIEGVRVENKELEKKNQQLSVQLDHIRSDYYIETLLRDGLGYARKDEIIIVLPDEEVLKGIAPTIADYEEEIAKTNWQKWAQLFDIQL